MRHAEIKSTNSKCPGCGLVWGYVVVDRKVECPVCHTTQNLPVVLTDKSEYYCIDCRVEFSPTALPGSACHQCGSLPQHNPPLSSA